MDSLLVSGAAWSGGETGDGDMHCLLRWFALRVRLFVGALFCARRYSPLFGVGNGRAGVREFSIVVCLLS